MKKIFMFLAVIGILTVSAQFQSANAQDESATTTTAVAASSDSNDWTAAGKSDEPIHQQLKAKFIEGGPAFMSLIFLCLILGLAIAIERIITLSLAQVNTKPLLEGVEECLKNNNIEGAKEICRNTRGPVASIFYQGLLRMDQGVESIEKAVASYGSVQMGQLESGLSWISLFIGVAPMLGFMGTVLGLIQAFDAIEIAGDISPNLVAGGMKVALITTVGGLIVAIILQLFYNYIVSKIETIVTSMEDASISLLDILVKYQK